MKVYVVGNDEIRLVTTDLESAMFKFEEEVLNPHAGDCVYYEVWEGGNRLVSYSFFYDNFEPEPDLRTRRLVEAKSTRDSFVAFSKSVGFHIDEEGAESGIFGFTTEEYKDFNKLLDDALGDKEHDPNKAMRVLYERLQADRKG